MSAHAESLAPAVSGGALPVERAACLFCGSSAAEPLARGRDYEYDTSPQSFELVRCPRCSLAYLQPRPRADAMSVIYPSNYYAYHEGERENAFVKRFRDRTERAKLRRYEEWLGSGRAELLDIGCGDGRLLDVLRRFGPRAWRLAGIEFGADAAARAAGQGFEVRSGDFESLELGDWHGRFDLALMHHVIEHTRDPRSTVRKAASLLRPGGILSVETPDLRGWDFELFRERYWGGYHFPRHFYLFDFETLPRLLSEEGFEVMSVRSMLSPAFWIHSVHNWLVDRSWGRPAARFLHPQNLVAVGAATAIELLQSALRGVSSNLQVIARRRGEAR